MCLTCLNLNWIKGYSIKYKNSHFLFFCNFVKKKPENLQLKNGHFMTLSGHFFTNYTKIFQKTEIQMVILRCLVGLNLNWIKSYGHNVNWYIFFHAWKCIISGLVWESEIWHLPRKTAVIFLNGYVQTPSILYFKGFFVRILQYKEKLPKMIIIKSQGHILSGSIFNASEFSTNSPTYTYIS